MRCASHPKLLKVEETEFSIDNIHVITPKKALNRITGYLNLELMVILTSVYSNWQFQFVLKPDILKYISWFQMNWPVK